MGLTQKILVFTGLLIVALVGATVLFTTRQADRLAHAEIGSALDETKGVWETFQNDRYKKLTLGVRTLGNEPNFKAFIKEAQEAAAEDVEEMYATIQDTLRERKADVDADFFIVTDPAGIVIARSDRPGAGEDLSKDPLVMKPIDEGEAAAAVWRQGDRLFHAVSVLMRSGSDTIGVLLAGYAIDEALAGNIQKLTHSKIAYLTRTAGQVPLLSVSSLGDKEHALRAALADPAIADPASASFQADLAGDRHVGIQMPLKSSGGEVVGSVLALRSVSEEMSGFRRFRDSLVLVSVGVMLVGLAGAYVVASRISGPVRRLVGLVEQARDGSYSGAVSVSTSDEIGTLAKVFNGLLADLREKEQMIGFLREGMTMLKKAAPGLADASTTDVASQSTASLSTAVTLNASTASISLERGSLFDGRYEVLETLGKGGMGIVYRAHDRKLDETVALKLLRPDVVREDPTLLDRFKQEIKLARRITHKNILRTHDFGEANGVPYISMEYLEGVTLKDLVRGKGALPIPVGLRIAKQMCHGLEAAHRQDVVHRDVKPHNMLIMPETGDLKIMDFGIARLSEVKNAKGMTSTGTVMGTPDYMAPEQAQGEGADFRADIYSLGVVFYEIFTGRLPFGGDTAMVVVLKHIQEPPPPPRSVNPRLPAGLEALILRCLEKDPAKRYPSVEAIDEDLAALSSTTAAA
jgi:HAMP domain-containing protein/predicted Ser/Thr protein kinase